ncbi:hypothetical protein [Polyangium aurulentum]|uniref:hypothetical protein n=1 Tax=Polyangium aurulentum TaxID=2567896 RepID=UPI0010AE1AAB|nr:hypothetical protein [Polyangium aurulentum]UQA59596.1 hypothetical protein E8A73_003540 [Polyangium aurulentum]
MRLLHRWLLLGAIPLATSIATVACEAVGRPDLITSPGPVGDGGSMLDAGWPEASLEDAGSSTDASDASSAPVLVALTPNPAGDGTPSIGQVIDARLKVLAAGARGVVMRRALRDLDATALAALAQEGAFYSKHEVSIALTLALVDRAEDTRPSELVGAPWDAPEVRDAVHQAIDGSIDALGPSLSSLVLGRDVDVYLAAHPELRPGFEIFALDALAHARAHPGASPDLRVGVGFSFVGATLPDPSFEPLLEASDMAVLSYLPGLGEKEAGLTTGIAAHADAMVASAGEKPILLESFGYPSSSVVGGSPAKQALFLETFFGALGPRRASFGFVNVEMLGDLGPVRCSERAAAQGEPPDGPYAAYICSLGLVTVSAEDKPAWTSFLQGAAAFASP